MLIISIYTSHHHLIPTPLISHRPFIYHFFFRTLPLHSSMATAEVQSVTHVLSSEPTKVESCEELANAESATVEIPEKEAESEAVETKPYETVPVEENPVVAIEEEPAKQKINGEEVIVEEKKLQVEAEKVEEEVVAKEVEGVEEAEPEAPAEVEAEAEEPPLATTVVEVVEESKE